MMFILTDYSYLQTETVQETNCDNEVYYFHGGCVYEKSTICKLLKSKAADSRTKLKLLVTKVIEEDHENAFAFLVHNNYQLNILNDKDQTATHLAFYHNCRNILFQLGLYLLEMHDSSNYSDSNGLTYLHVACYMDNRELAEKLLSSSISNGMDVNLPLYLDFQGYKTDLTLLHFAVTQSSENVVKLLLEYGASVEARDALGRTPLHLACSIYEFSKKYFGVNIEIMKILLEAESNVNAKDNSSNTPIMSIFPDNYFEFQTFKGTSFFDAMVAVETLEKLKLLVQHGADLTVSNNNGDTVLHLVIRNMRELKCPTDHPIVSFADTAHVEMVGLLLSSDQKVNVNADNNSGETIIELAVASMSIKIVKMLLKRGVNLKNLQFDHRNPIWFYHPLFIPDVKSVLQVTNIIGLMWSYGFRLSFQNNLTILKFFMHDYDECECGNVHDLPNREEKRVYLVHLLHYGSPKHIKHVLKKALRELSSKHEESFMDTIYILIGEYLRYVKIGGLYIDEEVLNIIKDFKYSDMPVYTHPPMYSLKDIEDELDRMKYTKLKKDVTLYDIMVEDPHNIAEQTKGCGISSKFKDFPCYKEIIEGHLAKSWIREYFVNSAGSYLKELMHPYVLPLNCCKLITTSLSNEDILAMNEAIIAHKDL